MDFVQAAHAVADVVSPRRSSGTVHVLDQVLTWGTRLTVFIVPFAISPWTAEIFEFSKQLLLLCLSVTLLVIWLARAVAAREVQLATTPLNWVVLGLLGVTVAATVFSIDWITSTLGFYGRFNGGLVSLIAYLAAYFVVLQVARDGTAVRWLVGSWLTGVGIGAVVLLIQMLGIQWLPFPAAAARSFTPLGRSLNSVVLLLAAVFPLALFFAREAKQALARWAGLALAVVALLLIFTIDYQLGWVGLLVASACWLAGVFWKNKAVGLAWTILPSLALLLSIIGWPLRTPALTQLPVPVEVNLSLKASWQIASQNVRSNPLLGTGPETFIYGFSKFKPENFNDTDFWAFRFDKASSEFAHAFATTGILGLVAQLALVLVGLWLIWRVVRNRDQDDWYLRAALAASFLVLLVGQIFYFATTTVALSWWFILALVASLSSGGRREVSLTDSPRASFAFTFALAVVVLVAAGVWFGAGRFFAADAAYARAQAELRTASLGEAEASLVSAVKLNPLRDVYYIGLAQVRLAQANRVAREPLASTDAAKQAQLAKLQGYLRSSIEAAQAATNLGRENVANWEALGSIYRGTVLYAQDAERWVVDSFEQAILREPKNPALYSELGKAYLIASNRKRQAAAEAKDDEKSKLESEAAQLTVKAIEYFDQAVKLKANYTPAHFNQALALEQQGKLDEAVAKLESMRSYNPQDIDVLYELGSLYYAKSSYDQAAQVFTAITQLVPNHANAHYGLAIAFEKLGKRDEAITQLEQVLTLTPQDNPNRAAVQEQLDNMRRGEVAPPATPPASQP